MAKQNANAMSAFVRTRHEPAVGKAERQAEIPEVGCALEGSGTDCHKEMPPSGSESIVSRGKPRSASVPEKLTFAAQATGLSPADAIFVCRQNHNTFRLHRVEVSEQPELGERCAAPSRPAWVARH